MNRLNIFSIILFTTIFMFVGCTEEEVKMTENPDSKFETGTYTDTRDGNIYNWVKIGDQTWFTENLKFKADSGCWAYNNDESLIAQYGYLYNWQVASNIDLAPEGWHLPVRKEWDVLIDTLGKLGLCIDTTFTGSIAKSLVSAKTWDSSNNFGCPGSIDNESFRNRTHFSALAAGVMYADTTFGGENYFGNWWSAEGKRGKAYFYRIANGRTDLYQMKDSELMGLSIRCVKDEPVENN